MRTLQRLKIKNFKSIREQELQLRPLNVFIGGNGAGKSNLIEVFRFLNEIVNENLTGYTLKKGGADSLLHFGRKRSPEMMIEVQFSHETRTSRYSVRLAGNVDGGLYIEEETSDSKIRDHSEHSKRTVGNSAAPESRLRNIPSDPALVGLVDILQSVVYHFHDTSDTAPAKGQADLDDNRFLRPQAENLAAFLYWMQEQKPDHFSLIQDTIRQIAPFFDRFQLEPLRLNPSKIRLEWRERGSDAYFNASSLSDGTLRFICLATLLLQPDLPPLVLLDEPELGLHPAAITTLAGLLSSAATRTQVIVATQSVTLVNQFSPDEVWAVDRADNQSVFRPLDSMDQNAWLEHYALGEMWEKNLVGARP